VNPALDFIRRLTMDADRIDDSAEPFTNDEWNDYADTVKAALAIASERRFGAGDYGEVIRWVGDIRARASDREGELYPLLAERLIGAAACDDAPELSEPVNGDAFARVTMLYIPAMLRDLDLSEDQLDAFFAEAEDLAQQWRREG